MKHRHHIIPKYLGGTDDPSNIALLSVEDHAQAHLDLYEKYGNNQDWVAYCGLSGKTTEFEIAHRELVSEAMRTRVVSAETRRRMSEAKKGRTFQHTEETKQKMVESSNRKPVYCLELDITFSSSTEAAKQLGCSRGSIHRVASGKSKGLFLNKDKPGRNRPKYRFVFV